MVIYKKTSIDLTKKKCFTQKYGKKQTISRRKYYWCRRSNYTFAHSESLLHSQKKALRGIDLSINSIKTEFVCFYQDGAIFLLNSKPLILIDQFAYLGRNISSTKSNDTINIGKTWTATDKLRLHGYLISVIKKNGNSSNLKLCLFYFVVLLGL